MRLGFGYRRYRLPFGAPVRTAHGWWGEREGLLIRLQDERGRVGFGEAAPIPWFGTETVEAAEAAARALGDAIHVAEAPQSFGALVHGSACLCNALASAWADLREAVAAGDGVPSGASSDAIATPVAANACSLPVAAWVPAGRAAIDQIKTKADAGFRVFKWKVGVGAIDDELAMFDDVCAALPDRAKLRLDANGAWDRRQAERWLERCAERPVEFIEQPCFAGPTQEEARRSRVEDVLRGLAQDYPTPIALDESLGGERDLARWLGSGWPGVYVVKLSLLADPAAAVAQLAAAKAHVVFSSALETAVGARAALRRAFGWAGERRALGFGVWPLFADRRFDGPAAAPFLRASDLAGSRAAALWELLGEQLP